MDRIGPYRIVRLLGEGGMGIVYRAEHLESGEAVALKVLRLREEALLASFRREIHALRSLQHPAVVRIVDDGVAAGQPWYAMALLRGETLGDIIDHSHSGHSQRAGSESLGDTAPSAPSAGPHDPTGESSQVLGLGGPVAGGTILTPNAFADGDGAYTVAPTEIPPPLVESSPRATIETALAIVRALCTPLAFVHGEGLVHRDLKPDNIVITEEGYPVLVDFGLVLSYGRRQTRDVLDVAGRAMGTPPYMSPEQILGDLVDARSDLYALGCILYETITGSLPFTGSAMNVLSRHLRQEPRPPSELSPSIEPELDALVMRLLAKNPRDRLGYAVDVAKALADLGVPEIPMPPAPAARPYLYRPALAGRGAVRRDLVGVLEREAEAVVLIGGRSGIGKTRLAMELANRAARHGMRVVTGHGVDARASGAAPEVKAAPLHALRELLLVAADRCAALGGEESERLLADDGPILAPFEPRLARLPGQEGRAEPPLVSAEAARFRVLEALTGLAVRLAEVQPIFIVIDDLHWADELTVAFLRHLEGDRLAGVPLRVVATYRSDEAPEDVAELAARVRAVELGPIDRDAVCAMVSDMLALVEAPAPLVDFLMAESEGNPFFIAEYLGVAVGERILERSPSGTWMVRQGASVAALRRALPLPGGLYDLVRHRFDQLSLAGRKTVALASVLGRELDGDLVIEVCGLPEKEARTALSELRSRQILEEGERGALRFVHDKLREVIYSDIAIEARRELHRHAAEGIERRVRGTANEALALAELAHHFDAAGVTNRALEYQEKAGEHALCRASSADARRFFARALELGRDAPLERRAAWERRLGEACYNLGALEPARDHLRHALHGLQGKRRAWLDGGLGEDLRSALGVSLALATQVRRLLGGGPPRRERPEERWRLREAALAAERLGQVHFFLNERAKAFGAAMECAHHAERLGASAELARGYASLGVALGLFPNLSERYGRRAEAIADEVGDPGARAFVSFLRGLATMGQGHHGVARRYLSEALEAAKENGDVRAAQEITGVLANAWLMAGRYERAKELFVSLGDEARRSHNAQGELWSLGGISCCHVYRGEAAEALAVFAGANAKLIALDDRTQRLVNGLAAFAHTMAGSWGEAGRVADATLALARNVEPAAFHCHFGYVGCCEVYLAAWEKEGPIWRGRALEAVALSRRFARNFRMGRPEAFMYQGWALRLEGRPGRARRLLRRAVREALSFALPYEEGRARLELSRCLPRDEAEAERRAAEDIFASLGSHHFHQRSRRLS